MRRARKTPLIPLSVVFAYIPNNDLASLSRVSKRFRTAAQSALYRNLDLSPCTLNYIDQCITLLASKREIAEQVCSFVCPAFPSDSFSFTLALTMAFRNMRNLTSASLPHFFPDALHDASFHLKSLVLLQESMPDSEHFTSWLPLQPDLTSLSIPHAITTDETVSLFPAQSTLLSNLSHFAGPPLLAAQIIPGRPVKHVTLHINSTLYDGLRPAALMSSLACSSSILVSLSIISTTKAVDARTLAKLFLSAGSELPALEELSIGWVLEEQVGPLLHLLLLIIHIVLTQ